jgi:hypothetical protein
MFTEMQNAIPEKICVGLVDVIILTSVGLFESELPVSLGNHIITINFTTNAESSYNNLTCEPTRDPMTLQRT